MSKSGETPMEGGFSDPPSGSPYEFAFAFLDPFLEINKHAHRLPHWQQGQRWIFVTWRLWDSLSQRKLAQWHEHRDAWLSHHPEPWDDKTTSEFHERFRQ